jgi:hypothetical protein
MEQEQQPQPSRSLGSKISNTEWWFVLGAAAFTDVLQLILDFFAIGLALNRYIDVCIGAGLPLYLHMRGYKFDSKDWMWLAVTFLGEEIPGIDAAPLWCLDVWRCRKADIMRKKA